MSDIKFNGVIYGSSDSANITYKDTSVYNKLEELSASGSIDGIIVNVEIGNWIANGDVWTNTIAVEGISASDVYDISLYDDYSEEQANAYDFLITSIDTFNNQIVLTASEKIDVALSIILRGRVNLEDKNVFVSDLSATSIDYDNTKSGLDATNMQNAVDEIATMVNGLIVNVSVDSWDLQEDGTYRKIIPLEQITGKETLDVCLYPGDIHTNEQIIAFSELITSIETDEGRITLTALEEITVSFRIFLYGKINFDKNNLVVLDGSIMEVKEISQKDYDNLPQSEKESGIYITDGDELTAKDLEYDGSKTGLGANTQDAIDRVNEKVEDCFQSVSDGKSLVASAITDKGVTTASDATFETMANNILAISGFKFKLISSSGYGASKTLSNLTIGKEYLLVLSSYSQSGSAAALQYCVVNSCSGGTCTKITDDQQGTGAASYYKIVANSTTVTVATSDSAHRLFE